MTPIENILRLFGELPKEHPLRRMLPLDQCAAFVAYVDSISEQCLAALERYRVTAEGRRRLIDKLRNPPQFYSALSEIEVFAFLSTKELEVILEPLFPEQGADFQVDREGFSAFVEVCSLGPDETEVQENLASAYVIQRMRKSPSRYFISFQIDAGYRAYQKPLKDAIRTVQRVLNRVANAQLESAALYYFDPNDHVLFENSDFNLPVDANLEQLALHGKLARCGFEVHFSALEVEIPSNYVGVSSGGVRYLNLSDRLRRTLVHKIPQLRPQEKNIVFLDWSNCATSEHDLMEALYGTTYFAAPLRDGQKMTRDRRNDGFFASTTRVQAVVGLTRTVDGPVPRLRVMVFPTNNQNAVQRMSLENLSLLGDVPDDLRELAVAGH